MADIILPRSILDTDLYKVPPFLFLANPAETICISTVDDAICRIEAFPEHSFDLPLHPSFQRRPLFPSLRR